MRAYIHIGLPKTGTKAIQFALSQRRSRLVRAGWIYPKAGTTYFRGGHHALAWHLANRLHDHPGLHRFSISDFEREAAEWGQLNIIISSEELYEFLKRSESLDRLKKLFNGHDLYIVCYVREQSDFVNSYYCELLSNLEVVGDISDYAKSWFLKDDIDYQIRLGPLLQRIGGRLIVRPYSRDIFPRGDVVQDFSAVIGLGSLLSPLVDTERHRSPTAIQIAILQYIIAILTERKIAYELYSDLHRKLKRMAAEIISQPDLATGEPFWGIDPPLCEAIRDHYRRSNAEFFRQSGWGHFSFPLIRKTVNCIDPRHLNESLKLNLMSRIAACVGTEKI